MGLEIRAEADMFEELAGAYDCVSHEAGHLHGAKNVKSIEAEKDVLDMLVLAA